MLTQLTGGKMVNKGRVLLVDDLSSVNALMVYILEREGLSVKAVEDGPAACALAETEPFDVLLVDYLLPGMNGLEVAITVRQYQPSIAIALVTGSAHLLSPNEISKANIDHLVQKPFDVAALVDWVKAQLPPSSPG